MKYRKYVIIAINLLLIAFFVKIYFFDPASDMGGIAMIAVLMLLAFFNVWANLIIFVLKFFDRSNKRVFIKEIVFYILLIVPFMILFFNM